MRGRRPEVPGSVAIFRTVLSLAPAKAVPGLVGVFSLTVAARVLGGDGLGTYVTVAATVAFSSLAAAAPAVSTITRFADELGEDIVRVYGLWSATVAMGIVVIATSTFVAPRPSVPQLLLVGLAGGLSTVQQAEVAWRRGIRDFAGYRRLLVKSGLVRAVSVAVVAQSTLVSPTILFTGPLAFGSIVALPSIARRLRGSRRLGDRFGETLRYALSLGAVTLALSSMALADRLLLPRLVTLDEVAVYGSIYSIVEFSSGAVMGLAWAYLLPTVIAARNQSGGDWQGTRERGARLSILMVGVAGLIAVSSSAIWYPFLLGEPLTRDGVTILGAASVAFVFYAASESSVVPLHFASQTWIIAIIALVSATVNVLLLFGLVPAFGTRGAAVSTLFAYALMFLLSHAIVQPRLHRLSISWVFAIILLLTATTAVVCTVIS